MKYYVFTAYRIYHIDAGNLAL